VIHLRPKLCVLAGLLGSAVLNSAAAADSHAQTRIGRLFSGPQQRIELDRLRNHPDFGMDAAPVAGRTGGEFRPEIQRGPSALAVKFNGIVVRSDGHRVAWIDGVETAEGETTPTGVRIGADHTPGGRLRIRLSHGRTSAVLEPGQFVDDGGRMHEAYESRSNGVAGGNFGEHEADTYGGAGVEDAAASAELRKSVSHEETATDLVQASLRGARTGTSPLGTRVRDVQPAGDGMRMEDAPAKRDSGT